MQSKTWAPITMPIKCAAIANHGGQCRNNVKHGADVCSRHWALLKDGKHVIFPGYRRLCKFKSRRGNHCPWRGVAVARGYCAKCADERDRRASNPSAIPNHAPENPVPSTAATAPPLPAVAASLPLPAAAGAKAAGKLGRRPTGAATADHADGPKVGAKSCGTFLGIDEVALMVAAYMPADTRPRSLRSACRHLQETALSWDLSRMIMQS
jgi:hypothetical protein